MMTEDIYLAVCSDNSNLLKLLMGVGKGSFNTLLWEGNKIWPKVSRRMSALQLAVRTGAKEVAKMLIDEAGLNVNYGQASTALTTAIDYQRYDMMSILIERGAQVNKAIMHGYSGMGEGWVLHSFPIHMTINEEDTRYLQVLLQAGANPLKEYSDFISTNKYHTTIALLEAVRRTKHLHAILMLQSIPTLENNSFGIKQAVSEHINSIFGLSLTQDNSYVLQEVLVELTGKSLLQNFVKDDLDAIEYNQLCPFKLKQMCRRAIRKSYRHFIHEKYKNTVPFIKAVNLLPLPPLLIRYILFTDEVKYYE